MSFAAIHPSPSAPSDLQTRVASRKQELISEILEHKKNCSRAGAAPAIDRLKARLSELAHIVKEGVVDSRGTMGRSARLKLDAWIAK